MHRRRWRGGAAEQQVERGRDDDHQRAEHQVLVATCLHTRRCAGRRHYHGGAVVAGLGGTPGIAGRRLGAQFAAQVTQHLGHLAGGFEAARRFLLHHPQQQQIELARDVRIQFARSRRFEVQHLVDDIADAVGLERIAADQQFVERDADREQVGTGIGDAAAQLLGRHVLGRAQHVPPRQGLIRRQAGAGTGDAEIHDLDQSAAAQHHVGRLDVTMHDALGVSKIEPAAHRQADVDDTAHRHHGAHVEGLAQAQALDELHRDVGHPLALTDVIDGDDIRVVEATGGLALAEEVIAEGRALVRRQVEAQDLERDASLDQRIFRAIDRAHRALAQRRGHPISPDMARAPGTALAAAVGNGRTRHVGVALHQRHFHH